MKKISNKEGSLVLDKKGFNKLCNKIIRYENGGFEVYRKVLNQYLKKPKIKYIGNIYEVLYPYSEQHTFIHRNGDNLDFRELNMEKKKISLKDELVNLAKIRYEIINTPGNFNNKKLIHQDELITEKLMRLLGPTKFGMSMYRIEKQIENERKNSV